MINHSPEKAPGPQQSIESAPASVVVQPTKVEFGSFLDSISKMSDATGEDKSGDWSGSGGGTAVATSGGAQTKGQSARDRAIANLPIPVVMQKELQKHIRTEVTKLRAQAKSIAAMSQPGSAYKLNKLYAQIRHLNALLASLFEASVDVVKRLFIRVFIDKQTIQ